MGWMISSSQIHCFPSIIPLIPRMLPLTTLNRWRLPASTSRHSIPRLLLLHSRARQRKVICICRFLMNENMFHSRELSLRGWSAAEAKLQRAAEHFIPSSSESDDSHESSDLDAEATGRKQSMEDWGGAGRPAAMHEHRGKRKRKRDKCVRRRNSLYPGRLLVIYSNWRGLS